MSNRDPNEPIVVEGREPPPSESDRAEASSSRETVVPDEVGPRVSVGEAWEYLDWEAKKSPARAVEGAVEHPEMGRFSIVAELGGGGMGRVLEARDPHLRRNVAIKVVANPEAVSEARLRRFVAEAQVTAQLQHPNIIPVHDIGVSEEGQVYFVMKKIAGAALRDVIGALRDKDEKARREWSRHKLLTVFVQICNAVAYAHDLGVLHRDLKPENIMLGRYGEVLVLDWGVARLLNDEGPEVVSTETIERVAVTQTMDGITLGTPGYISPEQISGDLSRLDARSDVFSLGAILYELLCFQAAFEGANAAEVMSACLDEMLTDPRELAPEGVVVQAEIAEVCLKALARNREDRFETAAALGAAVEDFLEGARRREAAELQLREGWRLWEMYQELARKQRELLARLRILEVQVSPGQPIEERAELHEIQKQLQRLGTERAELFGDVVAACERALSQDPDFGAARSLLCQGYWSRLEDAEADRDEERARYFAKRVREHDRGRYANLLEGRGQLTLRTNPSGAEVICQRYDTGELIWSLSEPQRLGTTPLEAVPMDMGTYLLTIRLEGKRDTRYPVCVTRGHHWYSGDKPVPLYSDAEIGPDRVFVPGGSCILGGDPHSETSLPRYEPWVDGFFMSVLPLALHDYCRFINALHKESPEEAWARVPRYGGGMRENIGQYWERPTANEAYVVPEIDRDGDRWDSSWPVLAISWHDAVAYAKWLSKKEGATCRLPRVNEWEKAARGVDGRWFPWGDRFDPGLCKMAQSRARKPQPEPVGTFATDISVYGVRDMAGSVRDWCAEAHYDGDRERRPVKGGWWMAEARNCRAASRAGYRAWDTFTVYGFRICREP